MRRNRVFKACCGGSDCRTGRGRAGGLPASGQDLPAESKLIARLGADANIKGSIAWLKAKADAATQAGETQLAAMYTDRATRRSHLLDTLNAIGPDLAALVKAHCS